MQHKIRLNLQEKDVKRQLNNPQFICNYPAGDQGMDGDQEGM